MAGITNRHNYFVNQIETKLATITGLTVKTEFDLDNWQLIEMPYCYVELSPETLEYPYENAYDVSGVQEVAIWLAVTSPDDGDIRTTFADTTYTVEKLFRNVSFTNLTTSEVSVRINKCKVKQIFPVNTIGITKALYLVILELKYDQTWL